MSGPGAKLSEASLIQIALPPRCTKPMLQAKAVLARFARNGIFETRPAAGSSSCLAGIIRSGLAGTHRLSEQGRAQKWVI